MNLDAITIASPKAEQASLPLCLCSIGRAASSPLDFDTVSTVLGLALVAVARPEDPTPAHWSGYGADLFLAQTCRLFGLQVRDLHPPEVGLGMLAAEEFPQHFELSYRPLIYRALEHNQPVLAWRGWEGDPSPVWGVITRREGDVLLGATPHQTGLTRLVAPALQCYVVEQYHPRTPSSEELFTAATNHAHAMFQRQPAVTRAPAGPLDLRYGAAAFDTWLEWLARQTPAPGMSPEKAAHQAHARALAAARWSAIRCLNTIDAVYSPQHAAMIDELATCCETIAGELLTSTSSESLNAFWQTAEGHAELVDSLRAARHAEVLVEDLIRRIAHPVWSGPEPT